MTASYNELCFLAREGALIESIDAVIGWDERTYMPDAAGEYRAEQRTYLAGLAHQKRTQPRWGELLNELATSDLAKDPHSDSGTTIRQLKREYDKRCKLPQKLVEELTRTAALDVRLEAFNVFDATNYDEYVGSLLSPLFGRPVSAFPQRRFQIGVLARF